jgi:hypothetical protein
LPLVRGFGQSGTTSFDWSFHHRLARLVLGAI